MWKIKDIIATPQCTEWKTLRCVFRRKIYKTFHP